MTQCRIRGLVRQALNQVNGFFWYRAENGFSAVPHDCAEKTEVGRRQGATVQGRGGGSRFSAIVWILDIDDLEFSIRRNRPRDAN